jgi:hypothetical protein
MSPSWCSLPRRLALIQRGRHRCARCMCLSQQTRETPAATCAIPWLGVADAQAAPTKRLRTRAFDAGMRVADGPLSKPTRVTSGECLCIRRAIDVDSDARNAKPGGCWDVTQQS